MSQLSGLNDRQYREAVISGRAVVLKDSTLGGGVAEVTDIISLFPNVESWQAGTAWAGAVPDLVTDFGRRRTRPPPPGRAACIAADHYEKSLTRMVILWKAFNSPRFKLKNTIPRWAVKYRQTEQTLPDTVNAERWLSGSGRPSSQSSLLYGLHSTWLTVWPKLWESRIGYSWANEKSYFTLVSTFGLPGGPLPQPWTPSVRYQTKALHFLCPNMHLMKKNSQVARLLKNPNTY